MKWNNHRNKTGHMKDATALNRTETAEVTVAGTSASTDDVMINEASDVDAFYTSAKKYDLNLMHENTFTYSQKFSILVDEQASKKGSDISKRDTVNMMNTLIRDFALIEPNGEILQSDALDDMLQRRSDIRCKEYEICPNSCKLFGLITTGTEHEICIYCSQFRYKNVRDVMVPSATLKMMSCGDQIAIRLADDDYRNQLMYPYARGEQEDGVLSDVFDGTAMKEYRTKIRSLPGVIDVFVMLFVDGFANQRKV
ncbi:hypothetical protein BDB01DRAFT_852203 [Pilobolus umbonatus]|nr:hypothetical protein BDB01DRAFT_852203 [Pilobolus umbonatus]